MHLVHILLPLYDNDGRRHDRTLFEAVAHEMMECFGGLKAHTRAPAEGLWKADTEHTHRDDIVIYEVMSDELDEAWWRRYRETLEERFRQEQVVVRAFEVRVL